MRKGEGSGRAIDEDKQSEDSGGSCGIEETSSRESMADRICSCLSITVTTEELRVSGDTSWFDPVGNKEDGRGGESARNWTAHILMYPEEVSSDRSPRTVRRW